MKVGVVPNMDKLITMYSDDSKEPRNYKKSKYIKKKYHLIRDFIQKKEIVVK